MKLIFLKSLSYALTASGIVYETDRYFDMGVGKSDILWAVFVLFGLLITVIKDIIDHKIKTSFWHVFLSVLISIICSLLVKFGGFSEFKTYLLSLFTSIFAPSILLQLMDKGLVKAWVISALNQKFNPEKEKRDGK
ncbi:hypothetical protein CHRY9390_00915 [Chryseobacterium aquaeductus]|uniref:Uncharacterized protein n=1 Tax=Chryseobacterium aquaeductus TaxID=2675056 RepID=A0A9N8QRQ8_9FLAO|nr:hypothetical protein [Chryseobacterium aquaeductus]CAA7330254.1 hypothetical protein CHRY9390_00915 [Chryseobacterium potabilaquae]CAD7802348.1 hypothetical protein CHRY9390_00915 [Chryseobacterium aquaeductus]